MKRLNDKIAVITGGNSGIGLATAKLFVAHGAHVYITGRRQQELDLALEQIGSNATAIQGDVSNLTDLDHLFAQVKAGHGRIDVLFSNVGVAHWEAIGQITEASFEQLFATNVKGTVFLTQKALPLMRPGGSIILAGSISGSKGTAAMSNYNASKAAVRSLARSWAIDLKGSGIRVNVLSPGATSTANVINALTQFGQLDAVEASIRDQSPLGRMGTPEEVASAALFLASEDSSFMTGSELFVDGGAGQI